MYKCWLWVEFQLKVKIRWSLEASLEYIMENKSDDCETLTFG